MTLKPLMALCAAITCGYAIPTTQYANPYRALTENQLTTSRPSTHETSVNPIFKIDPNTYLPISPTFRSLNPEMHADELSLTPKEDECKSPTSFIQPSFFFHFPDAPHQAARAPQRHSMQGKLSIHERARQVLMMNLRAPIKALSSLEDVPTTYEFEVEYLTKGMHDIEAVENYHLKEIADCVLRLSIRNKQKKNNLTTSINQFFILQQIDEIKCQINNMRNHVCNKSDAEIEKQKVIENLKIILKKQLSSEDYATFKKLRKHEIALEKFRQLCKKTNERIFKQQITELDRRMLKVEKTLR